MPSSSRHFRIPKPTVWLVLGLCLWGALPAHGQPVALYDGTVNPNPEPPWLFAAYPFIAAFPPIFSTEPDIRTDSVRLDSTGLTADSAGYFIAGTPNSPLGAPLDRATGFTVWLDLHLISEEHSGSNDRAGFSLIVISDDKKGLEIGFWENRVWVQDDDPALFVQAEGVETDTTSGFFRYGVWVRGADYQIWKNGAPILTGSLRNYTAFDSQELVIQILNPYRTANFLFFGDNTSSAEAISEVAHVAVSLHSPGDLNGSGDASLADAIVALQALAGMSPAALDPEWAVAGGDVDGDFRAGLAEAVYALQGSAGVRQ